MLLMIDNYDSFTYNLVQYLGELGEDVIIRRNDEITIQDIVDINPDRVMISPGPGSPADAGVSVKLLESIAEKFPVFGVCLGCQCIGEVFGGVIVHANVIMHGKLSRIFHNSKGVFKGLDQGFTATRYHSLVIDKTKVPDCLDITAWTKNPDGSIDEIMGVRHKVFNIEGVQFHPESIRSQFGYTMLQHFLEGSNISSKSGE